MATGTPPTTRAGTASQADPYYEENKGSGWIAFAGCMIALVGTLNIIYGIAAIGNSKFFIADTKYIISGLNTYGWVVLIVGVAQLLAAFAIFGRNAYGRWVGILSAGANVIVQLTWIAAYPLASVSLMAIDVLVIYALVAYGKHRATF